jgi:hypothetical protein
MQREIKGRFVTAARCSCSPPASTRYDPCYWTIALCVDLHASHAIAAFGSARRGHQRSAGRPRSPAPAASAAGRHPGRVGRFPGDTAVSAATTAAIVVRGFVSLLSHRRIARSSSNQPLSLQLGRIVRFWISRIFFTTRLPLEDVLLFRGPSGALATVPVACLSTSHVRVAIASVSFLPTVFRSRHPHSLRRIRPTALFGRLPLFRRWNSALHEAKFSWPWHPAVRVLLSRGRGLSSPTRPTPSLHSHNVAGSADTAASCNRNKSSATSESMNHESTVFQ